MLNFFLKHAGVKAHEDWICYLNVPSYLNGKSFSFYTMKELRLMKIGLDPLMFLHALMVNFFMSHERVKAHEDWTCYLNVPSCLNGRFHL